MKMLRRILIIGLMLGLCIGAMIGKNKLSSKEKNKIDEIQKTTEFAYQKFTAEQLKHIKDYDADTESFVNDFIKINNVKSKKLQPVEKESIEEETIVEEVEFEELEYINRDGENNYVNDDSSYDDSEEEDMVEIASVVVKNQSKNSSIIEPYDTASILDPHNNVLNPDFQNAFITAQNKALFFLNSLKVYKEKINVESGVEKLRKSEHYYAPENGKIFKLEIPDMSSLVRLIGYVENLSIQFYTDFYLKFNLQKEIPHATVEKLLFAVKGAEEWNRMQSVDSREYTIFLHNAIPLSEDSISLINEQSKSSVDGIDYPVQDIYIYQDLKKVSKIMQTEVNAYKASFLNDITAGITQSLENKQLNIMELNLRNQNPLLVRNFLTLLRKEKIQVRAHTMNVYTKPKKSKNK